MEGDYPWKSFPRSSFVEFMLKPLDYRTFEDILAFFRIIIYGVNVGHARLSQWYPLKSLSVSHAEHASMSAPREQSPAMMSLLSMPENASTAVHASTSAPLPPSSEDETNDRGVCRGPYHHFAFPFLRFLPEAS